MPAGMTTRRPRPCPKRGPSRCRASKKPRGARVQPGQKVLINGAGGGSGMYAVQLAKLNGAEVTGVDNAEKLEFMRSLGADHVIDYTRDDFTSNGRTYHLILDLAAHRPAFACKGSLMPGGRYLYVGGSVATLLQVLLIGPVTGRAEGKKIRLLAVRQGAQHLASIVEPARRARSPQSSTAAIG